MNKHTLNFSYFYFLPFLKSSLLELQKLATLLSKNQDLNKEQAVKSIISYCVSNDKSVYQLNSDDQIEVSESAKYPTGYLGWELTKEEAFKLSQEVLKSYSGGIKTQAFFNYIPEYEKFENQQEFHNFDYLIFINVFLAFGLNLKENSTQLMDLLDKCQIAIPSQLLVDGLLFFEPENYLHHEKYCEPNSHRINNIVLLNDLLRNLRLDEYTDVCTSSPQLAASILKNSTKATKNGNLLFSKLLGVVPATLARADLSGSEFLLERFLCFFNIKELEKYDQDYAVELTDEQINLIDNLKPNQVFLSPKIIVESKVLLPLLKGLYYLLLKYGSTKFFDRVNLKRQSFSRIFKTKSFSINLVYRFLHLLNIHENEDMQNVLIAKSFGEETPDFSLVEIELKPSHELENRALEQVDELLNSSPKVNDFQLYGKLYALPQMNLPITQKLDKESLNSFFKNSAKATELLLNFLISQSGDFEYPEVLVSMHKLNTYKLNGFDADEVIAFSICDNCSIKNNFSSLLHKLDKKVFAYVEDKYGKIEYKCLQLKHDNSVDYVEFYDVSSGEYAYKTELPIFCNNTVTVCFPKVVLFI